MPQYLNHVFLLLLFLFSWHRQTWTVFLLLRAVSEQWGPDTYMPHSSRAASLSDRYIYRIDHDPIRRCSSDSWGPMRRSLLYNSSFVSSLTCINRRPYLCLQITITHTHTHTHTYL
jgi:hypothetical protein